MPVSLTDDDYAAVITAAEPISLPTAATPY
jgi:hypothetical protein